MKPVSLSFLKTQQLETGNKKVYKIKRVSSCVIKTVLMLITALHVV